VFNNAAHMVNDLNRRPSCTVDSSGQKIPTSVTPHNIKGS
jgi:hypothetical protein